MKFSFFEESFFESKQLNERIYWVLLSLVLVFVGIVRYKLLDFPLERDEGEYAYMGQLMLQGVPPYKFAYNMKLPGTYAMYALIMQLFGETTRGIHLGFLLMNLSTIVILFSFIKKLCNSYVALFSAAAYGVFALNPYVLGFAAHATHFVLFWSLLGVYLLLVATEKSSKFLFFAVGLLFGLGFLMKQQAIFLILFSGFYFLYFSFTEFKNGNFKLSNFLLRGILLVSGTLVPFLITLAVLFYAGVFESFWYWTFQYASKYAGMTTLSEGFKNLSLAFRLLTFGYKTLWILVGIGFVLQFFLKQDKPKKVFLFLLVMFSFLTTTPGLYFREHYFIVFLPFAFIYFGISLEFFRKILIQKMNFLIAFAILCVAFLLVFRFKAHKEYYLKPDPMKLSRSIYGSNPFLEAIHISEYIKANTNPEDMIAVIGCEPEIYFYANRKSATGYIYMYPLMEIHPYSKEMQINMIREIETNKPKYIVYVYVKSWGMLEKSERIVLEWIEQKMHEKYERVGIAEILSLDETIYKWGDEAKEYKPTSEYQLEVLKLK